VAADWFNCANMAELDAVTMTRSYDEQLELCKRDGYSPHSQYDPETKAFQDLAMLSTIIAVLYLTL
jgi:hypothetical protein